MTDHQQPMVVTRKEHSLTTRVIVDFMESEETLVNVNHQENGLMTTLNVTVMQREEYFKLFYILQKYFFDPDTKARCKSYV